MNERKEWPLRVCPMARTGVNHREPGAAALLSCLSVPVSVGRLLGEGLRIWTPSLESIPRGLVFRSSFHWGLRG